MADPLNLLTENKQTDPLGLLGDNKQRDPLGLMPEQINKGAFYSMAEAEQYFSPEIIKDVGEGIIGSFKIAPFKLGESLLGVVDRIDQFNPFKQLAQGAFKAATGKELPKDIMRPAREASLYLRNLANQQAPKLGEGTPGYYAHAATNSILTNVPSIALGFATGSEFLALMSMAAQVAEDKYNERILAGDSETRATINAGLQGAAEALGEKIPLGILMKNKGIRAILLSSLTEIPSEIATTIMQNGIDLGLTDQTMSFADWKKSIYDTAIITGISAPFTAGLGRGLGVGAQKIIGKRQAGMIKPIIETQPIITPVETSGEGNIDVKTETKGQNVTASIDGKQVGSYDGDKLTINKEYEGNRYQIATELIEAHKQAVDAMLTTSENGAKKDLSDELRSKGLEEAEIAQRQGEIRTGSEAAVSAKLAEETGAEEQKLNPQSYEDFIAQIEQKEQPEKTLQNALDEKDFETLSRYVNNFDSAETFARALGETYRKPSKFWKDEGYVSAYDFYRKNALKRSTQETLSTASYEGFVDESTGELIGEDYKSADMASLESLLKKIERLRKGILVDTIQGKKKAFNFEFSLARVKTVIRERTGQTRVDNLVNEMDALEFAYKKAEQASRDAYRKGDRAGTLAEHERMTLIQELRKARLALNKETRATFKWLDSVNKKLDTMRIPDEYRDAIRSALSYDGDGLETFSLRQLEAGDLVFIPEDMIETLKDTQREGITLEQLRNQKDIVKTLLYQARALNKIEVLNQKVAFNETVETIVNEVAQAWEKDASTLLQRLTPSDLEKQARLGYKGVSRFQEIRERVSGLLSYVKKAEYIIEKAVNSARDTRLYQSTFGRAVEGEKVEITNGKEINDRLKEAVDLIKDDLASMTRDEYEVEGLLHPITKQQAVMIALNSGNEQNRAAIKGGYGYTDANIDAIVDSLNDKETAFVLKVWDIINSQGDKISEQYRKLTGLPMKKVEGQYFPLKYDTSVPQTTYVAEQQEKQDLFKTYSSVASVFRGFTKQRVKQTSYPPLLDFSVITRHLADVNHFIAWGVPVRDINRILTNPMVKEALIQSVGEDQYNQLRPWLKGIANDHFDTLKYVDTVLGKLVNNSSVAILGYALSTTLLQPAAIFQAVNYKYEDAQGNIRKIGVNEITKGVVDFYKSYGENADLIYSLSPWMSVRTHNFDFNVRQAMEADTKHPFNDRKFRDAAFAMMGFMDKLTSLPVWWTAYNIEMKESGDLARAVDFADKVVRNSQASGSAKDLSEMQRGGNVRRAFTMFQTFFNSTYNEWGKTKDLVQGERVGSLEYAKTFMWICLLPAMLQALFRYRDDMLEDPLQKVASESVAYGFGSIPIVGSFVNALLGKYEFRPTPAVSLPTELIKLTYSKDVPAFLKHGAAATGYLTGLPTRQAILTGEYIFNLLEGEETDPFNIVYKKPKK